MSTVLFCYSKRQIYGCAYITHFSNRFASVMLFPIKFENILTCLVTIIKCYLIFCVTLVPCFGKIIKNS